METLIEQLRIKKVNSDPAIVAEFLEIYKGDTADLDKLLPVYRRFLKDRKSSLAVQENTALKDMPLTGEMGGDLLYEEIDAIYSEQEKLRGEAIAARIAQYYPNILQHAGQSLGGSEMQEFFRDTRQKTVTTLCQFIGK